MRQERPPAFPDQRSATPSAPSRRLAPAPKELVSVADAAEYTGVCGHTIRRWIKDGRITGYRLGAKMIRVDLSELDRLARPIAAVSGDVA